MEWNVVSYVSCLCCLRHTLLLLCTSLLRATLISRQVTECQTGPRWWPKSRHNQGALWRESCHRAPRLYEGILDNAFIIRTCLGNSFALLSGLCQNHVTRVMFYRMMESPPLGHIIFTEPAVSYIWCVIENRALMFSSWTIVCRDHLSPFFLHGCAPVLGPDRFAFHPIGARMCDL